MSDTRFSIVSDIDLPLDPQTQQRALLGDISAIVKLGDCFFMVGIDYQKTIIRLWNSIQLLPQRITFGQIASLQNVMKKEKVLLRI